MNIFFTTLDLTSKLTLNFIEPFCCFSKRHAALMAQAQAEHDAHHHHAHHTAHGHLFDDIPVGVGDIDMEEDGRIDPSDEWGQFVSAEAVDASTATVKEQVQPKFILTERLYGPPLFRHRAVDVEAVEAVGAAEGEFEGFNAFVATVERDQHY
jgi:hypothetical protein